MLMAWGISNSPSGLNSFESLEDVAKTARFKAKGKKIASETRVRIENENLLVVKLYNTDILKFHRDGAVDIIKDSWCVSNTTKERLWRIGQVSIHEHEIPAVNGYKLEHPKQQFISLGWNQAPHYAYNPKGGGWIRKRPDETFDESTITPFELTCVADPKELRKTMMHLGKIARLLSGYAKIEGSQTTFEKGTITLDSWLLARYKTPIDQIEITPFPHIMFGRENKVFGKWVTSTVKSEIRNALDSVRFDIARREGWLGKHKVLKLE